MIRDVHHVGIAVSDMNAALALFREALGLPVVKEGEAPARGARVALLAVGGSYLELVQPTNEESPFARHIAEYGEGLHHVGLWTDDIEAQVRGLREAGVALEDREPREGFTGRLSYLRAEAFDGVVMEVVEPGDGAAGEAPTPARPTRASGRADRSVVTQIDHVVLRVPDAGAACGRFEEWFGVTTKRTFERGPMTFAFLRPGDVILEVIGPTTRDGDVGSGRIAGLALEVKGIDDVAAGLKEMGYPIGEPHPALQGGRIVSVHHSGACGVPLAFIDFG